MLGTNWIKKKGSQTKDFAKELIGIDKLKDDAQQIKELGKKAFSPKEAIANAKRENFTDAVERLKVTDLDLMMNYKNQYYSFYISLLFTVICFLLIMYYLFFEKRLIAGLSAFSIMLVCLANCFRFSFRAFQIKYKKLCSPKDWWERSNEWLPKL